MTAQRAHRWLIAARRAAKAEIDAAVSAASAAPAPEPSAAYTDVQTIGAGVWA